MNLLRTKDSIIIPRLGTESDREAMTQIEQLYPEYEGCIQIESMTMPSERLLL